MIIFILVITVAVLALIGIYVFLFFFKIQKLYLAPIYGAKPPAPKPQTPKPARINKAFIKKRTVTNSSPPPPSNSAPSQTQSHSIQPMRQQSLPGVSPHHLEAMAFNPQAMEQDDQITGYTGAYVPPKPVKRSSTEEFIGVPILSSNPSDSNDKPK